MTTLQEQLHHSVDATERALAHATRPNLHRRARQVRVRRQVATSAAAVAAVGAVGLGGYAMFGEPTATSGEIAVAAAPARGPLVLTPEGLATEAPAETVVVDVYLDPMCPFCGFFGTTAEPQLLKMEGVTVVEHPIAFLDHGSSDGSYSTRASSALQEVAANDPEALPAFLAALWANQPAEGSTLSDEQLVELALAAGVDPAIAVVIPEHRYAEAVASMTSQAQLDGVMYVPYIKVNGQVVENTSSNYSEVFAAVEAALASQ